MTRTSLLHAAAAAAVLGLAPATALAAGGPCSSQIAQLGKQLSKQTGLGAPVAEPVAGENVSASRQQSTGPDVPATAGSAASTHAGANARPGASAGTAGGVAGAVGAAAGTTTAEGIASGQIATSPADVRRQSEGLPTQAQAAAERDAKGGPNGGSTERAAASADKVSMAKSDLQNAATLNAKGDKSCMKYIRHARSMMKGA